jgi:transcription elongation factor Elf1
MNNQVLVKDHLQITQTHRYEWICPSCEYTNRVVKNGGATKYLQCEKCQAEIQCERGDWVAK